MRKICLGIVLMLAFSVGTAWAAPTFFGPTGLLTAPTASVLAPLNANVFANTIRADADPGGSGNFLDSGDDLVIFGANAGIGFGLEVGGAVINNDSNDTIINAKWNFFPETLVTPGLAVGVIDLTDSSFLGITPYVVASKSLTVPTQPYKITGLAGYAAGEIHKVFLGAEVTISPKVSILADVFAGDFSGGIRVAPVSGLRLDAGIIDGELGVGASYNLGFSM